MTGVTVTALDLITDAGQDLGVYAAGEPINATDLQDGLRRFNDLADSLSNDHFFIYTADNSIVSWTPGQFQYTIGNPVAGTFGGAITSGSPVITGVPATLNVTFGLNAANQQTGGCVTDTLNAFPPGTVIVSYNAGAGTLTVSQNANQTAAVDLFTYTAPGNFAINRPLRFRSGYTRITAAGNTGLDYWWDVCSLDDYNEIGYKGVPGPWPYLICYQPTFPYGTLWVYPNPSTAGEVHFFTDLLVQNLTDATQRFEMPQGYSRAFKKLLALEMAPMYKQTPSPELVRQANEARALIKSLNQTPVKRLRYDSALMTGNGRDASFIIHGGFGSNL